MAPSDADSLIRAGTPTRERTELWELLNLKDGQPNSGGWNKLLEATRSSKQVGAALQEARAQEGKLTDLLDVCFAGIAENTFFVAEAKKQFGLHSQMLEEIPKLREDMTRLKERLQASEIENANLRSAVEAAAAGMKMEVPPPAAPVVVQAPTASVPEGLEQRLKQLEHATRSHDARLEQAWQHIATEEAADEAIHNYFHVQLGAEGGVDSGESVEQILAKSAHNLSIEHHSHSFSHGGGQEQQPAPVLLPPPVAPAEQSAPPVEASEMEAASEQNATEGEGEEAGEGSDEDAAAGEGSDEDTAAMEEEAVDTVPPIVAAPAASPPFDPAQGAPVPTQLLADLSGKKVARELASRQRTELLASDLANTQSELN